MSYKKTPGTVGGRYLRALREQAGKTQLELELDASLGIGYLQRLELGKVSQPERETLERILSALNVRYAERCEIMEVFGYMVETAIPSAAEIHWAIDYCQSELDRAPFPVYVLDCTHRLTTWNAFVPKLFPFTPFTAIVSENIAWSNVFFEPSHGIMPAVANPDVFFPAQIRVLRFEMGRFGNAAWNQQFIERMLAVPHFERYWNKTVIEPVQFAARPLSPLVFRLSRRETALFRVMGEPLTHDPRFRVIYYLPADADTFRLCSSWAGQMSAVS